jgi:hypothetical protein
MSYVSSERVIQNIVGKYIRMIAFYVRKYKLFSLLIGINGSRLNSILPISHLVCKVECCCDHSDEVNYRREYLYEGRTVRWRNQRLPGTFYYQD